MRVQFPASERQLPAAILGSSGRVSEILNGKRNISKSQAKPLAQLLRVPVDLFL